MRRREKNGVLIGAWVVLGALAVVGVLSFPNRPASAFIVSTMMKKSLALQCSSGGTTHSFTGATTDNLTANACTTPATNDFYSVTGCSIYVVGAGGDIACSIYSDSGTNEPRHLLCQSDSRAAIANSVNTLALTGCPTLEKSKKYWITWNANNAAVTFGESSPGSACSSAMGTEYWRSAAFGTWYTPFDGTTNGSNCLWQTYLNITPSAAFDSGSIANISPTYWETVTGDAYSYNFNDGQIDSGDGIHGANFRDQGESWQGNAWVGEAGGQRYFAYFRFQVPASIPAGTSISSMTLSLYDNGNRSWNSTSDALRIWVQKSRSTPQPVDASYYPGDFSGTTLTTTSARWPTAGGLTWTTGGFNTSPNFSAVMQEVVDAYGGLQAGDWFTIWVSKDVLTGTDHQVGFVDSTGNPPGRAKVNLVFTPVLANGTPSKLLLVGPTKLNSGYCSETPFAVTVLDATNKAAKVSAPVTVNLTTSGGGAFYSDASCSTLVTSISIATGAYSGSLYFKNSVSETVTLTATDNAATLTASSLTGVVSSIRPYTWIGNGGDSLWSNPSNWSTGVAPLGTYTGEENVFFDSNCIVCSVTVDVDGMHLGSIRMINGYTGTITMTDGYDLYLGKLYGAVSPGLIQDSGTFTAGAGFLEIWANFALSGGTFNAPSAAGGFNTEGMINITGGTFNHNNGAWYSHVGNTDLEIDFGGITVYDLNFVSGWQVAITGNLTVAHDLTIPSGGASLATWSSATIDLHGNLTIGMDGSTGVLIRFVGPGAQTWSGNFHAPSIEIASGAGTVTATGSVKGRGSFTYTSGTFVPPTSIQFSNYNNTDWFPISSGAIVFNNVTFNDYRTIVGTMHVGGNLTFNGQSPDGGAINVAGNLVGTDWGSGWGSTTITMNGTGAQTISRSAGSLTLGDFIINKASGTASFSTNMAFLAGQNVSVTAGTLDMGTRNITGSPNLSVASGATLKLAGSQTVTLGSFSAASGSSVVYAGTTNMSTYNLRLGTSYGGDLTFDGVGGQWRHGVTTVGGSFAITNGSVTANNNNLSVAGNWSNSGTYTPGTNTVTFNGTNQSIAGTTSFYRLTKTVASAATLSFASGSTTNVTNTMTLQGAAGQLLSLRSSSAGVQWNINPSGTRVTGYLDVKDSNNTNGTAISGGGTSTNSGNNTNWTLP